MKHSDNHKSTTPHAIEVSNLSVSLGGQKILSDMSFEIKKGELVAIIGPNGAGKTTLLRAMLELVPHKGKIKILDGTLEENLTRIAYVPQKFNFDHTFPLTVNEFLHLYLKEKNNKEAIEWSLKEVELTSHKDKKIGNLSGGQMQRLLIARALLGEPKILFLDEPTSGVDLQGEKSFFEIIKHLNEDHGVTIVVVSHEINMVYKFATQIICLNRDLICFGEPKLAITNEVLSKLYGDDVSFRPHQH